MLCAAWAPVLAPAEAEAVTTLASGFSELTVASGFTSPTAFDIAADGRVFVAEQRGVVKVLDNVLDPTPSVVADLRTSVHRYWDRGLLGLVVDREFPDRPYVYLLYDYDAPPGGQAPVWGTDGADADGCHPDPVVAIQEGCVATTRITRLQVEDGSATTEKVLVDDICTQIPAHSGGGLTMDERGVLYAALGDAAWSFSGTDYGQHGMPPNPCGDPPGPPGTALAPPTAEGGSLRAQDLRTPGDPLTFRGALIEVDPDAGGASMVAHGFRNPFRITTRPGTDEVWVGDVGHTEWEEIDRVQDPGGAVENFGWPCYEGSPRQPAFDAVDLDLCEGLYAEGSSLPPAIDYRHAAQVAPGDGCPTGGSAVTGVDFYEGGGYPANFRGALFLADAVRGCIWAVRPGDGGVPDPSARSLFARGVGGIVDLRTGPGGDLYYLTQADRALRRIRFDGANAAPTAVIESDPSSGPAPLAVTLDARRSNDPDPGDTLTYAWDLDDDGAYDDATSPTVELTLEQPGDHTVRLRVSDGKGSFGGDEQTITVGSGPVATITEPLASTTWATGEAMPFAGEASGGDGVPLPASRLTWSLLIHHCHETTADCHVHHVTDVVGTAEGSFPAPAHEHPARLELRLTATDDRGLTDVDRVVLDPRVVEVTVRSEPAGLQVRLGSLVSTEPVTRTVIVGSPTTVGAPSPQSLGGREHDFGAWSDAGSATHTITPTDTTTLTATYTPRNRAPVANAGPDQSVRSRTPFRLDGTGSSDPDDEPLTYRWRQVSGPPAVLRNEGQATADVEGVRGPATIVVELTVTDPHGATSTDLVTITVRSK